MKRFLRLGEGYVPSRHKPKYLKRYISLLAVLTTMCLYAVKQVSAQEAEPAATAVANVKPLQIGDTIPEYLWQLPLQVVNHSKGQETATLLDYKGKFIVLEFWSRYCASCIAQFPKLNDIQEKYGSALQLLLVASDSSVFPIYHRKKEELGLTIPVAISDGLFNVFDIVGVPHAVIIDGSGVIRASTYGKYVTEEAMASLTEGKPVSFPVKPNGHQLRQAEELWNKENATAQGIGADDLISKSLLTRARPLLQPRIRHLAQDGKMYGIRAFNLPGIALLKLAYAPQLRDDGILTTVPPSRLMVETEGESDLLDSVLCYEFLLMKELSKDTFYTSMAADLNRVMGIQAGIHPVETKVLLLVGSGKPVPSTGDSPVHRLETGSINLTNKTPTAIARAIEQVLQNKGAIPVIDATGYGEMGFDFSAAGDITDLGTLKHALAKIGLNLVESQATVDMLVIKDN